MKQAAPSAWLMPTESKGQAVSSFKVTKKLPPGTPGAQKLLQRFGEALGWVRVGCGEKALQSQVKAAGGVSNLASCLWTLPQRSARRLDLSHRIRALQE